MIKSVYYTYRYFYLRLYRKLSHVITSVYFFVNGIRYIDFVCIGIPLLDINPTAICEFGTGLVMVSRDKFATLGRNNRCKIVVSERGKLVIGNKVAMSNTTIVATMSISLGNNILIGGGVTIVDSDFHSLNSTHWHTHEDVKNMNSRPVIIENNVFIGMNSIILKGVHIGSNVIIAAGSVITKNIPNNQIWGGNPAKFIKENKIGD